MHKATRSKTLTGTVTAHVTAKEEQCMKDRAAALGLTKSEWCRQVLLQAIDAGPEARLLLAELMAVRKIFLKLHADALEGQESTAQRMKAIVEEAEATKHAMATQRIHRFHAQAIPGPEPNQKTESAA